MNENELINESAIPVTDEGENAKKFDTPLEKYTSADEKAEEAQIDYEALVTADMDELSKEFSGGEPIKISDLKNPVRYGALRDLGLTPKEAYLASGGKLERFDNRSHLASSVPRNVTNKFSEIPRAHLDMARDIFSELSDGEIRALYRKVTQ